MNNKYPEKLMQTSPKTIPNCSEKYIVGIVVPKCKGTREIGSSANMSSGTVCFNGIQSYYKTFMITL